MRLAADLVALLFYHVAATTQIYTLSLHDALPISLAVPAKLVRGLLERFGTGNALRPKSKRAVGPNVYLAHLADCAGQNIFDGGTRVVHGMALVAHLCCDLAFFRCARHLSGFVDGPGQLPL